jgi:hypothetical protein
MNPEKLMPRILATPVRRPIEARRPGVLSWKGFKASLRTLATIF